MRSSLLRSLWPFLFAFALIAGCGRTPTAEVVSDGEARRLLVDRSWIDHNPRDKADRIYVYRFTPSMGGGVFQDRTLFVGSFELFFFTVEGSTLRFLFPQNGDKREATFRIEKLPRTGRDDFDLRLTLTNSPRGPAVYYGWSDATRSSGAQVLPPLP